MKKEYNMKKENKKYMDLLTNARPLEAIQVKKLMKLPKVVLAELVNDYEQYFKQSTTN